MSVNAAMFASMVAEPEPEVAAEEEVQHPHIGQLAARLPNGTLLLVIGCILATFFVGLVGAPLSGSATIPPPPAPLPAPSSLNTMMDLPQLGSPPPPPVAPIYQPKCLKIFAPRCIAPPVVSPPPSVARRGDGRGYYRGDRRGGTNGGGDDGGEPTAAEEVVPPVRSTFAMWPFALSMVAMVLALLAHKFETELAPYVAQAKEMAIEAWAFASAELAPYVATGWLRWPQRSGLSHTRTSSACGRWRSRWRSTRLRRRQRGQGRAREAGCDL